MSEPRTRAEDRKAELGLTYEQLSEAVGLTAPALHYAFQNPSYKYSPAILRRVCIALQCTPEWLLYGDDGYEAEETQDLLPDLPRHKRAVEMVSKHTVESELDALRQEGDEDPVRPVCHAPIVLKVQDYKSKGDK